jgi:hypothetical protein
MRQVWITKRGGPEVLQVREAADPAPKEGEVRIRVAATAVNFADVLARMGLYPAAPPLPAVVGYEVAGTVDWLEAEENYVRLHAGRESYLVRRTLAGLEERLDPARFVRVHRSHIVNLAASANCTRGATGTG